MPPFLPAELFGNPRQSTPPPMESPLPRTPKPQRFLNPPRTPLAKLNASFGGADDFGDGVDASMLHAGMAITRPSSACSNYSCSSDSSVDSNTTYSTTGGSCTSVEDEDGGYYDTPKGKAPNTDSYVLSAASERQVMPEVKGKEKQRSGRSRKTQWTESMDAHLWKTYLLYQQDPKITPFFVLPGAVPPLGVCCKVARETKRSWKEAKLNGDYTPIATPKPRSKLRAVQPISESSNRGDALRKTSPYIWPASEASTRRRLRELCRENYGLSRNPYHNHQQRRGAGPGDIKTRPSSVSPSPLKSSVLKMPYARDPFSSTRSMALSLTTSTASSMRPSGALAALASGRDIHSTSTISPRPFGGITERIESATTSQETQQNVLATGSLGLGLELSSAAFRPRHGRQLSLDSHTTPSLLPPLELKSSRSPYGTWPRRLKRPEHDGDEGESSTPLPPRSRARRGTLIDLFGDEPVPATPASKTTRTRARGYTISAGTNPLGTRRRSRPSVAPLLTVTGPVSYDSPTARDDVSPTARRDRFENVAADLPRRLGSPFAERERERD
ncbi:hypothetical protein K440DRAFT_651700 [Wilcoxina mikolae CBS 423.85]|nr:hypothetical protein K440DRAFT_651700 [Wilcoxina mikolae CBS 423.85]